MMQTRCPACGTTFHVTPEQMRVKGGKVRCGHCHVVFNALAYLMVEVPSTTKASLLDPMDFLPDDPPPPTKAPFQAARQTQADKPLPSPAPEGVLAARSAPEHALPATTPKAHFIPETTPDTAPVRREPQLHAPQAAAEAPPAAAASPRLADPIDELTTARPWQTPEPLLEKSEGPVLWPFVLACLILASALGLQLAHYFRSDLVGRFPATGLAFKELGIHVPSPRHIDLVAIETSDLQADPTRKQLNLNATLVNKANFSQEWPLIELTLTDPQDNILARRVFKASEYLGAKALTPVFPPRQESTLRLVIDNESLNPAGYRLYVFYP